MVDCQNKIGDFLVSKGFLTEKQKENVIKIQKVDKKCFGKIAEELGYINIDSIIAFLIIEKNSK